MFSQTRAFEHPQGWRDPKTCLRLWPLLQKSQVAKTSGLAVLQNCGKKGHLGGVSFFPPMLLWHPKVARKLSPRAKESSHIILRLHVPMCCSKLSKYFVKTVANLGKHLSQGEHGEHLPLHQELSQRAWLAIRGKLSAVQVPHCNVPLKSRSAGD